MSSERVSIIFGKAVPWPQPAPVNPHCTPPRRQRQDGTFACEYCDDCGDVHSIIGDWLGVCHCEVGRELQAEIDASRARRDAQEAGQRIGADG